MNFRGVGVAAIFFVTLFSFGPITAFADIVRADATSTGYGFFDRHMNLHVQTGDLVIVACQSYTGSSNGSVGTGRPNPGDQFDSRSIVITINGTSQGYYESAFLGMQSESNGGLNLWYTTAFDSGLADIHIPEMQNSGNFADACSAVAYRGNAGNLSQFKLALMSGAPNPITTSSGSWLTWVNPYGVSPTPPTPTMQALDTGYSNILQDSNGVVAPNTYQAAGILMEITAAAPPAPTTCVAGSSPTCNSNVMFLPGMEASRLYAPGTLGENQIWEPDSLTNEDVPNLDMINQAAANNVYTKEGGILDYAYNFHGIYAQLIIKMSELKGQGFINDWEPIAYDWRLDYQDLLSYGHQTDDGKIYYRGTNAATTTDPYIVQQLKHLASTSRTGKVTIIAHSNGGLLAKALLSHPEYAQYVDKLIMVATPQLGTPQAIAGLLHGANQALPTEQIHLFLTKPQARTISQNMPVAYNLLPSNQYFTYTDDSVITFDPRALPNWAAQYGDANNPEAGIHSTELLRNFMTDQSRGNPSADDVATPSVVNLTLFNNATVAHNNLDNWHLPNGIQLITIAGWGNETLASIEYTREQNGCAISGSNGCAIPTYSSQITFNPNTVIDGDGTVVEPSAQWANGTTSTRYWVDLYRYNKIFGVSLLEALRTAHAEIFQVPQLETLLSSLITNSVATPSAYITTSQPTYDGNDPRLHFVLHSPLTLGFIDTSGNFTGSTATTTIFNIPGVDYERFGEVQWLSVPKSLAGKVIMHGTGSGSFTLDIQNVNGNSTIATTTFAAVPSSTSTVATIVIDPVQSPTTNGVLSVDENGDGTPDLTLHAQQDTTVLPDITPPEIKVSFSTSTNALSFTGVDDRDGVIPTIATTSFPTLKKNQKTYQGIATTTVIARDQGGNTTSLVYTEKLPSPDRRDSITLKAIVYNGATTTLSNTAVSYKWRVDNSGMYKLFASFIQTAATSTESHWRPKKNLTIIMQKPQDIDDADTDDDADARPTKIKVPGMVILFLTTNKGVVRYSW